jgi:hypothetical protein
MIKFLINLNFQQFFTTFLFFIKFTETIDVSSFSSTTSACKPISHDKNHYYLPFWDYKPSMNVRCIFPNLLRRMYNSNILSKLTEKMEIGLSETSHLIDQEDVKAEVRLRNCLEELASDCQNYIQLTKASITGPGTGKTKLDKERIKLCQREIESIGNMARNLKALVTRSSLKERFKTAHTYLVKLRFLVEDVSIKIYCRFNSYHALLYLHQIATTFLTRYIRLAYCKWKENSLSSHECS